MLAATKDKARKLGRWLGKVIGAVAPFIPDPKAKLAAGAAAAALNAATAADDTAIAEPNSADEKPNSADDDPIVGRGDSV